MVTAQGSCLCGAVSYEVDGDFESLFLCHCARCRKGTGSAHAANLFSTAAVLRWISGAQMVRSYQVPDSLHARSFCDTCGTPLPSVQMEGKLLVVPAGSLDSGDIPRPNAHIFTADRAAWDDHLEEVSTLPKGPGTD